MRSRGLVAESRAVTEPVRLELELAVVDPIKGTLREPGEAERPFQGWLQLLSALEAACTRMSRGSRDEDPAGANPIRGSGQ